MQQNGPLQPPRIYPRIRAAGASTGRCQQDPGCWRGVGARPVPPHRGMEFQPLPVADLDAPAAEDTDGPWRAVAPTFGKSGDDAGWYTYVLWRITLMLKILKVAAS